MLQINQPAPAFSLLDQNKVKLSCLAGDAQNIFPVTLFSQVAAEEREDLADAVGPRG